MRSTVTVLYLAGYGLILAGAVGAWLRARARFRELVDAADKVRANYDSYQAVSQTLLVDKFEMGLGEAPEAAARVARIESGQAEIKSRTSEQLAAVGIVPSGTPGQETWIPIELQIELTLLTGTLRSLGMSGTVVLVGGLLSTVASVWSLHL